MLGVAVAAVLVLVAVALWALKAPHTSLPGPKTVCTWMCGVADFIKYKFRVITLRRCISLTQFNLLNKISQMSSWAEAV